MRPCPLRPSPAAGTPPHSCPATATAASPWWASLCLPTYAASLAKHFHFFHFSSCSSPHLSSSSHLTLPLSTSWLHSLPLLSQPVVNSASSLFLLLAFLFLSALSPRPVEPFRFARPASKQARPPVLSPKSLTYIPLPLHSAHHRQRPAIAKTSGRWLSLDLCVFYLDCICHRRHAPTAARRRPGRHHLNPSLRCHPKLRRWQQLP